MSLVYSVKFGLVGSGTKVPWLDMVFLVQGSSLTFLFANNNREWVHGGSGPRARPKLLPFLGCSPYRFSTLRGILYGKLVRGFSQGLSQHATALRVLEDAGELLRLGYPKSFVRAILHSLPAWMSSARAAQRTFRLFLAQSRS